MSARSSARNAALAALVALTACSTKHKPEADPARLTAIMKTMDKNTPTPGAVPNCTPDQMVDGAKTTRPVQPSAAPARGAAPPPPPTQRVAQAEQAFTAAPNLRNATALLAARRGNGRY